MRGERGFEKEKEKHAEDIENEQTAEKKPKGLEERTRDKLEKEPGEGSKPKYNPSDESNQHLDPASEESERPNTEAQHETDEMSEKERSVRDQAEINRYVEEERNAICFKIHLELSNY